MTDETKPPPVAPLYCDQCQAPMTEVEPGVWTCNPTGAMLRRIFGGARVVMIQPQDMDPRRHSA